MLFKRLSAAHAPRGKTYGDIRAPLRPQSESRKRHRQQWAFFLEKVARVLLFLSAVKLICEIALLSLMGQGLLFVLAGAKRDSNFFYQLIKVLTRPFIVAARAITPRQVADAHVGLVAFFLLLLIWAVVTFEKIRFCVDSDMVGCR